MIHVIATIQITPGKRDTYLEEFGKLVPLVRAEAGCLDYAATVDEQTPIAAQEPAGDDTVIVIEKWESVAALRDHLDAPHMTDYRTRVKDIVRGTRLRVLRPV